MSRTYGIIIALLALLPAGWLSAQELQQDTLQQDTITVVSDSVFQAALEATSDMPTAPDGMKYTHYDWSEHRHSLSLTAGYVSGYWSMSTVLFTWIVEAASHGHNARYYGAYGLQYHYQFLWWLRFGAKIGWEGDGYEMWDKNRTEQKGNAKNLYAMTMASLQFTYFNRRHVQLYSGVDVGVGGLLIDQRYLPGHTDSLGNSHRTSGSVYPALNITALGVAFGNERVYGLVEANVGADAFIKAGLGVHL